MTHPSERMSEAEIVSIETDDLGAFVMLSSNNRSPIRYAIPLPVAEAFRTDLAAANERAEKAEKDRDHWKGEYEGWEEREAQVCPEDYGFEEVIDTLRTQLAEAQAEILRRDSFYGVDGCSTGDCPHDTVQECSDAQAELIREQEAKIAKLYQERDRAIKLADAWHEYADCQTALACDEEDDDTLDRRERAKQVIHECGSDEDSQAPRSYSEIQKRCDELENALRSCRGNASVLIESEACPGCTAVCITADEALSRLTTDADASGEGVGK